jgi:tight adherence protein C
MFWQAFIISAFAVVLFGSLMLLLLPLALKPSKEAQRVLDVVLRPISETTFITGKERFLDGILSVVRELRNRLHLMPNKKVAEKLAMAGYWSVSAPDFYFGAQLFCPALLAWAGSLVRGGTWFGIFIGLSLGFALPEMWLTGAIAKRRERIRRSLPDAIDLLVICVDGGLGLDQAVLRVSEELVYSRPELQQEFHRVHLEQRAGRPRAESWQNLAERTKLPELASFVSLLTQSDRFGTQVTKALSNFADDIRERHRQRVEEAAAQTKIKIIFPLVFFIFPCLFIVLLGPAVLTITHDLQSIIRH